MSESLASAVSTLSPRTLFDNEDASTLEEVVDTITSIMVTLKVPNLQKAEIEAKLECWFKEVGVSTFQSLSTFEPEDLPTKDNPGTPTFWEIKSIA